MAIGEKARMRIERKERSAEETRQERREEQYQSLEEVFDKATLMVVYQLFNKGVLKHLQGVIRSGKESRVYHGIDPSGKSVAVKIYLTVSSDFKRGMIPYIEGDKRFNAIRRDTKGLVYIWAQKEFKNLERAIQADIRVPKPIDVEKNVLMMEFIGQNGVPAVTLKEEPPKNPVTMYKTILKYVKRLYRKANLVHADLSEYNIMNQGGKPVLIDMSQSVLIDHPHAEEFLVRDLENINRFFSKLDVEVRDFEPLYKWVTGNEWKRS